MRKITYENYLDKIWGGWLGKCAGGILGAPIEGFKCFNNIELSEELFKINYPNDDLDLQVLWLDLVKQKGPWIDENDFGEFWREHVDFPWCEYGLAARNLVCGVMPPLSGKHNNNYWYRGMGSPIRSEIWGMLCAGDKERAAYYAKMDSSLDHNGFSVKAEMFLSACEAEAFFESNISTILKNAISIFPEGSEIVDMYNKVVEFNKHSSYEIAKGKIKSYFGDADFTSSPMNVAFLVHALLNIPAKLESLMKAVNLGHDSDCISATLGALIGTIIGYKNIDSQWKEFIGDELMVSPEIKGLEYAKSISELSKQTAIAGLSFFRLSEKCTITGAPVHVKLDYNAKEVSVVQTGLEKNGSSYKIFFEVRNNSVENISISLKMNSEMIVSNSEQQLNILPQANEIVFFEIKPNSERPVGFYNPYQIEVMNERGNLARYNFGIPNYGEWLMLGPFIEDNKDLIPMHPIYPDHGLASLPSVDYMNHDILAKDKDFLSCDQIHEIVDKQNLFELPFQVSKLMPASYQFCLEDHFVGRGERTIFLATKIVSGKTQQKWICYGGTSFINLWVNGKQIAKNTEIKRSWPMAFGELIDLNKGENYIIFRLDCPIDTINFQAGLKSFQGKHYHQSSWETELIPTLN